LLRDCNCFRLSHEMEDKEETWSPEESYAMARALWHGCWQPAAILEDMGKHRKRFTEQVYSSFKLSYTNTFCLILLLTF
jgi:hypothetical protein